MFIYIVSIQFLLKYLCKLMFDMCLKKIDGMKRNKKKTRQSFKSIKDDCDSRLNKHFSLNNNNWNILHIPTIWQATACKSVPMMQFQQIGIFLYTFVSIYIKGFTFHFILHAHCTVMEYKCNDLSSIFCHMTAICD